MDEFRDLIDAAKDESKKKDVMDAISYLVAKNIEEVFPTLKEMFFHPLTNHDIRMQIGRIIASTKSKQIYNLLITHLILRNFSDLKSIIYTLGEYQNKDLYSILVREFPTCNYDAQLEIVIAMGKIKAEDSVEFFSKIYNGDFNKEALTANQFQKLKEKAGESLQSQFLDL